MDVQKRLKSDNAKDSIVGRAIAMRGSSTIAQSDDPAVAQPITSADGNDRGGVDIGTAVRAFLKELDGEQHPGIVSPSQLFSLFHRHLQVQRGSLLVFDPSERGFLPIATVGLDETSRFRLRLDHSILGEYLKRPSVRMLNREERERLRPVLSTGDFRRSPRIAVFPFAHLQNTLAILLVFDSPVLDLDPAVLDVLLAVLSERAGRLLFDGRERPLARRTRATVFGREHLADALERIRRRAQDAGVAPLCVEVSLASILQSVSTAHPHLDSNRLVTDILTTVALLTSRRWITIQRSGVQLILLGLSDPDSDPELLVHLIGTTLCQLFGTASTTKVPYTVLNIEDLSGETNT